MSTKTQVRKKGLPEAAADYIRLARELGISVTDDLKDVGTLLQNAEQFLGVVEIIRKQAKERIDVKAEILKKFIQDQKGGRS